jgi:hypothetical protein
MLELLGYSEDVEKPHLEISSFGFFGKHLTQSETQ